jgi:4-amino-4-deoxy-L-arabinose transferase-like glycosyltransferase
MRSAGDVIWCGVSAPVIQGVFVGLGVSAVGLIVFPFAVVLARPPSGILSNYHRAEIYLKWGRRTAWALGIFAGATLVGYVILYTDADGKFCTEHFDRHMQLVVFVWTGVTGITFALLVATAALRGLTHRLGKTKDD